MSTRKHSIVCVYCKMTKPRPGRGEHLILDGLGGRATTRTVCGDCNSRLGKLDQEFLRNTLITLHRFLDPSVRDGEVRSPQFVAFEHGHLDIRLLNTGEADLLPQAALIEAGLFQVAWEQDQGLLDEVLAAFASGAPAYGRSIQDVPEHSPARLVVNRQGRSHLIRARTNEAADQVLAALRNGVKSGGYSPWEMPLDVKLRLSTDVNVPGRCVAKMAFNMAAEVVGPALMLEDRFDDVRAYILGDNVISGSGIGENGKEGPIIDYRFVDPWLGAPHPQRWPTTHHALCLGVVGDRLRASAELFGAVERFSMRLGKVDDPLSGRLPCLLVRRDDADCWFMPKHGHAWRYPEKPPWSSHAGATENDAPGA